MQSNQASVHSRTTAFETQFTSTRGYGLLQSFAIKICFQSDLQQVVIASNLPERASWPIHRGSMPKAGKTDSKWA